MRFLNFDLTKRFTTRVDAKAYADSMRKPGRYVTTRRRKVNFDVHGVHAYFTVRVHEPF